MDAELAVVGPGSVGAFFGAHVASTGRRVVACARRPFTEFVVDSATSPVHVAADVVTDPAAIDGPVPFVLVAVKAHHTPGAAEWLDRLCGPGTVVVAAQNGLEAEERLAPYVNGAEVVQSVVYCTTELQSPGYVKHYGSGWLWLPVSDSMHRFAELFAGSGAEARVSDRYVTELWRKLGFNVTTNGVTAVTRRRLSVFNRPDIAELGIRLLSEAWTVAQAEGADLDPASAGDHIPMMRSIPGDPGTSTYYDRMAGRPTEHDAIYGSVVRAGRRLGIPTPFNETVWALLAASDADVDV